MSPSVPLVHVFNHCIHGHLVLDAEWIAATVQASTRAHLGDQRYNAGIQPLLSETGTVVAICAAFLFLVIFGLTSAAQIAATVQAAYLEPDPYGGACSTAFRGVQWQKALALLATMRAAVLKPDVRSYTAVISTCRKASHWQQALLVFASMGQVVLADLGLRRGCWHSCVLVVTDPEQKRGL